MSSDDHWNISNKYIPVGLSGEPTIEIIHVLDMSSDDHFRGNYKSQIKFLQMYYTAIQFVLKFVSFKENSFRCCGGFSQGYAIQKIFFHNMYCGKIVDDKMLLRFVKFCHVISAILT